MNRSGNNTYRKSLIALSIGSVMGLSSMGAIAAEEIEGIEEVERIEVTGSRIKRTDMEGALPITVISAADIQASGVSDIAGLLRQTTFAGNGSTINVANNSWGNHSSTGLRGLGSERTLALVNGRRIAPSSSASGHAVNLNMIPLEAIERVEILRDGASAIYGADAMGGVQNFILKKNYEGLAVKVAAGESSRGDMGTVNSSILFGMVNDKSQMTIAYEHMYDQGLKSGSRPHLDVNDHGVEDDPWRRLSSWAPHGSYQSIDADGNYSQWNPGPDCDPDMVVDYPWGNGGQKCGYDAYAGKNYYPTRKKDSVFATFTHSLTDELSLYAQSIVLRDRSLTATNAIWVSGNLPAGHEYNPTTGSGDENEIYYTSRLDGAAERQFRYETTITDFNAGFDWNIEAGDLNFNYSYSREKGIYNFNHDVFKSKFQEVVAEGLYDVFTPGGGEKATEQVKNRFRHTGSRDMVSSSTGYSLSWAGLSSWELPGGEVGYAVGAEYREYELSDKMDSQSAASADGNGDLIAAWGGDTVGERDYKAMFVEIDLPITEDLSMLIASRYDKWSLPDAGQASSSVSM